MRIKDSVVLITGGSSGIGARIALHFARAKAMVVINYKTNAPGAKEVLETVRKYSPKSMIIRADVSNPKDVQRMFKEVIARYGKLDILINNAAIPRDLEPFPTASFSSITDVINTDLVGPMLCSQEAIKYMKTGGKIINTSSIRGWESGGRTEVYSAAKAGLNNLTKTMARNYAPNILVNAVAPGFVKTRNYDGLKDEQIQSFLDQTATKNWVDIDDVAKTYLFVAKTDSLTGQVIYVDGGFTLK